jgi:hypothetical protein
MCGHSPDNASRERKRPQPNLRAASIAALPALFLLGVAAIACLWVIAPGINRNTMPDEEPPGSGTMVNVELTTILLPQAFLDLAHSPERAAHTQSHEHLRRYLHSKGLEKAWYALYWNGLSKDGRPTNLASFACPFEFPDRFPEFERVLDTLAGNPPRSPASDYSSAKVMVLPDRFINLDPREALAELADGGDLTSPPSILESDPISSASE